MTAKPLIPVTVLSGFLGSGKTTLLNRVLALGLSDTGVIVNEFGSVGIDNVLIEGAATDVLLLPDGCACCTMRNGLAPALFSLARRTAEGAVTLKRIVIETSGICDPTPILHLLMSDPAVGSFCRLDGVVTVVDAHAPEIVDQYEEAAAQVAVADHLCISKSDLASQEQVSATLRKLAEINPGAATSDSHAPTFDSHRLFDLSLGSRLAAGEGPISWLAARPSDLNGQQSRKALKQAEHAAHSRFHSFTACLHEPTTWDDLTSWMDVVANSFGPDVLRIKGLVATTDWPDSPIVIHGVRELFYPPVRLSNWPSPDRRSRLVFIGSRIPEQQIQHSLVRLGGRIASYD